MSLIDLSLDEIIARNKSTIKVFFLFFTVYKIFEIESNYFYQIFLSHNYLE